jgi:hypothetical protein
LATVLLDRVLDPFTRTLFDESDHAASAPGAADFSGPSTVLSGRCNKLVDQRRRNAGGIRPAQLPLFTQQPLDVVPFHLF